ncbi:MAG: 4Fe-4S binding protein [Spirochaetota bacterium]
MRQKIRKTLLFFLFLTLPITLFYFSPYIIIMGGFEGIIAGSFLLFSAQFLSSLFAGRGFCGWICPAGALQDCIRLAVDKPSKGGKANWIKYGLWVPWISLIVFAFVKAGGVRSIDPLLGTEKGFSVGRPEAYFIYLPIVVIIAVLTLAAGRRGFCHYVCWMAPFLVLGRKLRNAFTWPSLHLRAAPETCTDCKRCSKQCPMGLDVNGMVKSGLMRNDECILCGECVDGCPKSTIAYKFFGEKVVSRWKG